MPKKENGTMASQLDFLIPAEITRGGLAAWLQALAELPEIRTILEIGSSDGSGSTRRILQGLRRKKSPTRLFCLEVSRQRCERLRHRIRGVPSAEAVWSSSVSPGDFLSEEDVMQFYRETPTRLNESPLEEVLRWRRQDLAYLKDHGVPTDGIARIIRENRLPAFDLVLIDGSAFTGEAELRAVPGARVIALDDVNDIKNGKNFLTLSRHPEYRLLATDLVWRNGFAIFARHPREGLIGQLRGIFEKQSRWGGLWPW